MPSVLSGWSAVGAVAFVLLLMTVATCLVAMRGLLSTLAVAALSLPAMWLLARYVFGDASVYFPRAMFSEGSDGKDQVIIVSILCTVLGGIIVAACFVWLIRRLDAALNRRAGPQR
jgi:hypothetical protein